MSKKQYYRVFFNNNYFRDMVFTLRGRNKVTGKMFNSRQLMFPDKPLNLEDFKKIALNFLIRYSSVSYAGKASLFSSLSFFNNVADFKLSDKNERDNVRMTDRLFFDFDVEDERVTTIKKEMSIVKEELTGKEKVNQINILQEEFRKILFNTNILESAYKDMLKVYDYFIDDNIEPYTVFSGSKGFHLYVFIEATQLKNISNISYDIANMLKSKLNLKTLDVVVNKDALVRKSRVPYGLHESTALYTTPFKIEDDLYDILENSKKPEIAIFDFKKYADNNLNKFLIKCDNETELRKKEEADEFKRINEQIHEKKRELGYIRKDCEIDDVFKDMRTLLKVIVGEPEREFDEYNSYCCPFHDDNNPSAGAYVKYFYCSVCNLTLNYFDFIKKYYNLDSDTEVKKKMKELNIKKR